MKKLLILIVIAVLNLGWVYTYDTASPPDSESPTLGDDRIREFKAGLQERQDVDHYWEMTGTEVSDSNTGQHRKVTFYEKIDKPDSITGKGILYIKDANELTFLDEDDNETQLTDAGTLNIKSSDLVGTLANDTWFTAVDANGTSTANAFKVNGDNLAVLPDGALLEAATDVNDSDRAIADKGYVDDNIPTSFVTIDGSTVFNTTLSNANAFQDLDLSSYVGSNRALCFFRVSSTNSSDAYGMKPKGDAATWTQIKNNSTSGSGVACGRFGAGSASVMFLMCLTDANGVIQHGVEQNAYPITIILEAYLK